jgi:hypothetical protein
MSNFVVGQTITIPQTNSWEAHQAEIIEIADDVFTLRRTLWTIWWPPASDDNEYRLISGV